MIRKLTTSTLGKIESLPNIYEFRLSSDGKTKEFGKHLEDVVLLRAGKTFDLSYFAEHYGNLEKETVETPDNYTYNIEGEGITHINIVKYETEFPTTPGRNNTDIVIYTKHDLFSKGAVIAGPSEDDRLLIVDEMGQAGTYFRYRTKPYIDNVNVTYINPAALAPNMEWGHFNAPSSLEGSIDGPSSAFIGAFTRTAFWNSQRVSTKIGPSLANLKVTVYETDGKIGNTEMGPKTEKFFVEHSMEKMSDLYNESKQNTLTWGIKNSASVTNVTSSGTLQKLAEADGLERQRGKGNIISVNKQDIDQLIEEITIRSALTGSSKSSYIVRTGTLGFTLAASQIRLRNMANTASDVKMGESGLVGGYSFNAIRTDAGDLITFVLDKKLDNPVINRIPVNGGYATSYEWHVYNVGDTKSGKAALLYKDVASKQDIIRIKFGVRDTSGDMSTSYLKGGTKVTPTSDLEDMIQATQLGDFSLVNRDPLGSLVIRRSFANELNY